MKIRILEKSDKKIRFVAEGTNPQFMNALRRVAITEVPVLAIDHVTFYHNSSVLYDEILAHRLGQLPLKFDPKAFDLPEECSCEGKGCSNCQIVLVIDKKGPGMVYAKNMKSADAKAASPLFMETPLVELFEDQRLKAESVAKLGRGKEHAKYAAARAFYRKYPVVKTSGTVRNPDDCVKICHANALKSSGARFTVTEDCDLCQECVKTAQPEGSLSIIGDDSRFIFEIESISGLTAEQIMLKAVDVLKKKAKRFVKEVKKL